MGMLRTCDSISNAKRNPTCPLCGLGKPEPEALAGNRDDPFETLGQFLAEPPEEGV